MIIKSNGMEMSMRASIFKFKTDPNEPLNTISWRLLLFSIFNRLVHFLIENVFYSPFMRRVIDSTNSNAYTYREREIQTYIHFESW